MSSPPLWLTLEAHTPYIQILLSVPKRGTVLKARLPPVPAMTPAVSLLVESLSAWYGMPLYAVVDADAQEARLQAGLWAKLLGDLAFNPNIAVEWTSLQCPPPPRDRFLEWEGFASARRLLTRAATGQQR
ncbi:hypothetical protein [Myxococcus sp. CA040A]|uniref:hypothetical protein n=1 Tax=Myxococcus sp. CA040A TaxID=2741738 RepID=UPI00157B20DC|nr:hypothetical protein [Myxococcus sp. CA040A]NTX04859.1 hypothetical protein [Myxococcus sp. CA040A]